MFSKLQLLLIMHILAGKETYTQCHMCQDKSLARGGRRRYGPGQAVASCCSGALFHPENGRHDGV